MVFESMETPQMKAIKAAIPYLDPSASMKMWIVIKLLEIKNIIEYYKAMEKGENMKEPDIGGILNSGIFSSMSGEGKKTIEEYMKKINGKPQHEAMPLLTELIGKLNQMGINLSDYREAVISSVKEGLSPDEAAKFDAMVKMFTKEG